VPFQGGWLHVPAAQRSALGRKGRNQRLGRDAMLGGRTWDQSAGIALELGPMTLDAAERFFPTAPQSRHGELLALLDFLVEGTLAVALRILVTGDSIGPSRMRRSLRLGWSAWLGRDPQGAPTLPRTRTIVLPGRPLPPPT
jgi:type VI secretion system protein ImpH